LTLPQQANILDNSARYADRQSFDLRCSGLVMAGKTVTRADLCEAVYQKVGLSRTESATLVELVLKEITDCLERGETVKLSSFGAIPRPARKSRFHRGG
jgi:hypothetical protein